MRKRYTPADILCFLAIMLLPWQARWIYEYHLLNGQRYEYGTLGIYASSIVLLAAVAALAYERKVSIRFSRSGLALCAWLVVTVALQKDHDVGLYYAMISIAAFGYYVLASRWEKDHVVQTIIASGIVQTIVAWKFFMHQYIVPSTLLGVAEHMPEAAGQSVVIIDGERVLRAYGMLPHPNILGGLLVIVFGVALYQLLQFEKKQMSLAMWRQWMAYIFVILFLWSGILITFSRAALLSAALFIFCWLIYAYVIREKKSLYILARVCVYCALVFIVFNAFADNIWTQRFGAALASNHEQERLETISTDERIVSYHEAAVLAHPLALLKGLGLGGFVPALAQAFPGLEIYEYQPTHNAFVMMVLEIGIIGVCLVAWFCFSLMREAWKKQRSSVYGWYAFSLLGLAAFLGLFDHFLWTQYLGQSLWWLVVGLATNRGK